MTPQKKSLELPLKSKRQLNADCALLTFECDRETLSGCQPGQFFNLRPLHSSAPLLRRPISICDARPEEGELDLLVRVVGDGTRLLTERQPGATIGAVGPLGQGFSADPSRPALCVAGGVGVAPVFYLARSLARQNGGTAMDLHFCYGARSEKDFVLLEEIEAASSALHLTTEDGSQGEKGFVTKILEPWLKGDRQIFVCGPPAMMDAVLRQVQEKSLVGQFSLENQMGCGVGACMGCVVPGREGLIRVCCDGPVVFSDALERIEPH